MTEKSTPIDVTAEVVTPAPKRKRAAKAAPAPVLEIDEANETNDGFTVNMATQTSMGEIVALTGKERSPEETARIKELAKSINLADTNSLLQFGVGAQKQVGQVSGQMLQGVRAKGAGPAGEDMTALVTTLRGLNFSDLKPGEKPNFIQKILRRATPIVAFLSKYETVTSQVAVIQNNLEKHRVDLLRDVKMLDNLYHASITYLDDLDDYIAAGKLVLETINLENIPAAEAKARASGDMQDAQELNDLIQQRDTLERKVHDLQLTRTVTLQSIPTIRIVQENDKGMAEKIQSQILNTIPLWETQLAIAVSQWRAAEATATSRSTADFTSKMVESNAKQLRLGNAEIRKEIERGIVDVASLERANADLIATVQESIQISQDGKRKRQEAEQTLIKCEQDLVKALSDASVEQAKLR
jgi:uncharacterized protein YaaN involved in tellurite resistance